MNFLRGMNAHEKCDGALSRQRKVRHKVEGSTIDFIIVCDKAMSFFEDMKVAVEKGICVNTFHCLYSCVKLHENTIVSTVHVKYKDLFFNRIEKNIVSRESYSIH